MGSRHLALSVSSNSPTPRMDVGTESFDPRYVTSWCTSIIRFVSNLKGTGPRIRTTRRLLHLLSRARFNSNTFTRGIASWLWTLDVLPLLFTTIIVITAARKLDRRWLLVAAAILSLHAVHIPYWYVGIMGWHYVFETAPLWCLLLAAATQWLFAEWTHSRRNGLKLWWIGLLALSLAGNYIAPGGGWKPRLIRGMNSLAYPRHQQDEARKWIEATVKERPALVLVDQRESEASHLDFVTNEPGLSSDVLLGRFSPDETDPFEIAQKFPSRSVFVVDLKRRSIRAFQPSSHSQ